MSLAAVALPAVAAATYALAKFSMICAGLSRLLNSLDPTFIAVPAAAGIIPRRNMTMPVVEAAHFDHDAENVSADLTPALLAICDDEANHYADRARLGLAAPPPRISPSRDEKFVDWCGQLGYREGLEVRS